MIFRGSIFSIKRKKLWADFHIFRMMRKSGGKKIRPEPCAPPSGGSENAPKASAIIAGISFRQKNWPWTTLSPFQRGEKALKEMWSPAARRVIPKKNQTCSWIGNDSQTRKSNAMNQIDKLASKISICPVFYIKRLREFDHTGL